MDIAAIISVIGEPEITTSILLIVVAFHAPLLMGLSSRQRRSGHPVLRFLLWSLSAVYFPFMTSVLSYLTTYLRTAKQASLVLVLVVLIQLLRDKADMAAMAVAAVASPAAGDDDVNSLKIRPSTQSFINTFWVAGLVMYNISRPGQGDGDDGKKNMDRFVSLGLVVLLSVLWILGACRTVLRFAAFQRATGSFALGRNVQLIDGYMLQLREGGCLDSVSEQQQVPGHKAVPRLIVTGERNQDVVESPLGYHVKRSSLQDERSRLVMLDRVWSDGDGDRLLTQDHKDLCLSFALFKCLRRRFAGYRLAAEAGSSWAFRFVCDGLLGPPDDHDRMFRVIATELSFASDFFHSRLPVASMGTTAAAVHFLFSLITLPWLLFLWLSLLLPVLSLLLDHDLQRQPLILLAFVLALLNAITEISEMVASVRSNWTKISIIGHLVRSRHQCARTFLACLLKCKVPKFWDDKIRQTQLLKPAGLFGVQQQPWARRFGFGGRRQLSLSLERQNHHEDPIKVPHVVKKAILESLSGSGGQLSDGTSAIRRRCFTRDNYITWVCRDGGEVLTATDAILVWHIATTLFDIRCSSSTSTSTSTPRDSDSPSASTPSPVASSNSKVVACSLSRYCMYLVAEAPDLLPDMPAWTTRRYEAVKRGIEEAAAVSKCSSDVPDLYQHLVDTFSGENSQSHEVLIKGVRLGKQLIAEAERRQISQDGGGGGGRGGGGEARAEAEDEVWQLLSDFWSEILLYLAPSDNVKVHIEALQRGGELITLLWALLLHAGITSRPVEYNFTASVLLSTGDPDAVAVHNC